MRAFYLFSLLVISGCSSEVENSQYQEQIKVLVHEEDLVDFQSSSAVAEWTPSAKKEIEEIFDALLPTVRIYGEIQEFDPYKSKNLIGSYENATIIVPLENMDTKLNNNLIIEMNKKYYSASGDSEKVKKIIGLSNKIK